jgi:hypothetical protein
VYSRANVALLDSDGREAGPEFWREAEAALLLCLDLRRKYPEYMKSEGAKVLRQTFPLFLSFHPKAGMEEQRKRFEKLLQQL